MRVIITDSNFQTDLPEKEVLRKVGLTPERYSCTTEQELIEAGRNAEVILVQFAPVTRKVLESWESCKLIVRYGIGYDNIDVKAAEELNIQVCNVPSYCLDEVAAHTCSLILSAQRKIITFHEAVRSGVWDVQKTAGSTPKFSELVVGLVGFGRIGERVMRRLKSHSLLVNTSRGALIDTPALAEALRDGQIGGAALDVFEAEPFESDHPLRFCSNVIFTPHAAYYRLVI